METKKLSIEDLRNGKFYIYKGFSGEQVIKITSYKLEDRCYISVEDSFGKLLNCGPSSIFWFTNEFGFFELPPLEDILMNGELSDYYRR